MLTTAVGLTHSLEAGAWRDLSQVPCIGSSWPPLPVAGLEEAFHPETAMLIPAFECRAPHFQSAYCWSAHNYKVGIKVTLK